MIFHTNKGYATTAKYAIKFFELDNIQYAINKKKGVNSPETYKYVHFDRSKKNWLLPRSCKHFFSQFIVGGEDQEVQQKVKIKMNATLREDQQKIVDRYKGKDMGLIIAPTAFGKSFVIAGLINQVQQKTIVVAPRKSISTQLYSKYKEIFGEENVCYFKPNMKPGDYKNICVIVGTSFNIHREDLALIYKTVIIDEIHIGLMSPSRKEVLCKYPYDNLYGLTATPERDEVSFEIFEKIFYNVYDVGSKPIIPDVYKYSYNNNQFFYTGRADMIQQLNNDHDRMVHIANMIKYSMERGRNMGIALMETIESTEKLTEMLNQLGVFARAITGKTVKGREDLLADVEKNHGVLVATYQTVGTGFDYPPLDTLFYLIHVKFSGTIKQAVGRILRKYDGKCHPVMIDWHDKETQPQNRSREKTIKQYFNLQSIQPFLSFLNPDAGQQSFF